MAFVTDAKSLTIPVETMTFSTGTWATTYSTSVGPYKAKTPANSTTGVYIPLNVPRSQNTHGTKIKSIDLPLRVTGAALDAAPTVTLYRVNYNAVSGATADNDTTAVTITHNGVATVDANDRLLTITVSSPDADLDNETNCSYFAKVTLDGATSTTIWVYPATVYYDDLT